MSISVNGSAVPPAPTFRSSFLPAFLLWWLPRLAFLLFVGMVIVLLWFLDKTEKEEQRATLISDVLWFEQNIHFLFNHNQELMGGFDPDRMRQADTFEANARTLIANNSGLFQLIWLDQEGNLRLAVPPVSTSTSHSGEQQTSIPALDTTRLADSLGRAVYGPAYPVAQNDWQFEVHVPIYRHNRLAGTIVGIYSVNRLLDNSVPWWLAERYRIDLTDQAGKQLGRRSKVDAIVPEAAYQIPLEPPGHGMILRATPYLTPTPLPGRVISSALVLLAILVLLSFWALRRDVQRRLAAESALEKEVAFRKAMEDSVQTGLRARNLDGKITYVNPAFCRMVGWSAKELIDCTPPMPYWAEEYLDEARHMFAKVMSGQAPVEGFEMKFRRRNGEMFDTLIHEAPLIDSQGKHAGWMGSVVDITERKRLGEMAHQQEERLQASARLIAMGEMASSLAHELNQPLSAISGYATGCRNLIASGSTDFHEIDSVLAKCQEQSQRAGRIIRRIYEFARRHEPKSEACDLHVMLADLIALIESDTRRQQMRIAQVIAKDLPGIKADRILLGQALLNLMKNGIESMRHTAAKDRELVIAARRSENQVELDIADRGCGISAEDAEHLFEPFFTTKSEGLGVGLNICRSVIEAHHGRLWFEANPQGGSIFHITLPIT
jgi:two-component system, LuxR family, sensor histidine kinase DctS